MPMCRVRGRRFRPVPAGPAGLAGPGAGRRCAADCFHPLALARIRGLSQLKLAGEAVRAALVALPALCRTGWGDRRFRAAGVRAADRQPAAAGRLLAGPSSSRRNTTDAVSRADLLAAHTLSRRRLFGQVPGTAGAPSVFRVSGGYRCPLHNWDRESCAPVPVILAICRGPGRPRAWLAPIPMAKRGRLPRWVHCNTAW